MDKTTSLPLRPPLEADSTVARAPTFQPGWSFKGIACIPLRLFNVLRRTLFPARAKPAASVELTEIRQFAAQPTDINEHLEVMFTETVLLRPNLIVELGVRGGASTFVFERAAALSSSSLVSVDIDDCSSISNYPRWHFFRGDDVQFAADFPDFCRDRSISPSIDLLFIDTSHYYDHTVEEIRAWGPHLSNQAKIIFHDSNMKLVGPRKDGCIQVSWDNQRGVIRAIEDFLGIQIDESKECIECANGWLVRHAPYCNGLTILDRVPAPATGDSKAGFAR